MGLLIRKRYSETNGVILSTIDSSLGLDFKAVIVTGLYPYNYVFGDNYYKKTISSWRTIKEMPDDDRDQVQSQNALYLYGMFTGKRGFICIK